jgi:hypothetical protein
MRCVSIDAAAFQIAREVLLGIRELAEMSELPAGGAPGRFELRRARADTPARPNKSEPPRWRKLLRAIVPPFITAIRTHYKHQGAFPNLLDPQTFNEKLCYRKIFDRREILTTLADKYAARDYVAQRLGSAILPKLYQVTRNAADIPFDALPNKFVVKPTHGSGWVRLVRDKAQLDRAAVIAESEEWLSRSYYELTREWQYKNVTPRILVEEFIDDGSGQAPVDYKLMVFHGKVHYVQVHRDRFTALKMTFYDPAWNRIEVVGLTDAIGDVMEDIPRPERLEEMIMAAETLAGEMDFIRVDFYATSEKIYFGEFTSVPGNGVVRYVPSDFDLQLGRLWDLHKSR